MNKLALMTAVLAAFTTSPTWAGHTAKLKVAAPKAQAAGKVVYFGGPVINAVELYTVYWGNQIPADVQAAAPDFYTTMVNSDYMSLAKEYSTSKVTSHADRAGATHAGTNQTMGAGSYKNTYTIVPDQSLSTSLIDDTQIQAEIERQIATGALPPQNDNTLFMIHFPPGLAITTDDGKGGKLTSCQQLCAFHNGFQDKAGKAVFYSVIPDMGSGACATGCGPGSDIDRMTISASHEFMEAMTDPFPTPGDNPSFPQAWNTVDGEETGDLCTEQTAPLSGGATVYQVQEIWSNKANACSTNASFSKR